MLHTVRASHAHDEAAERAAIEDRLDLDVPLARTPPESLALLADAEVALSAGLTADMLDAAPDLRWVQAFSSGVDGYPLDALRERGVVLTNAAGIHAEPIAQQALGYLLTFSRRLHVGFRQQAEGRWERYEGDELGGKTLGLVGVGAVGTRLAELARALGMRVLGVKRDPTTAPDVLDACYGPDGLYEVLPEADYLVLACPLTDETRGLVDAEAISALPNHAVLVNVARGGVVDDEALVYALQTHRLRGAALDVFPEEPLDGDSPLWGMPNVVVTPHMAGSSPRKPERIAEVVAGNYAAFVAGDLDAMPTRVV